MSGFASVYGGGSDDVTTGSGDDTIVSGGGDDTVFSGSGDDMVLAGSGNDEVLLRSGDDTAYGENGDDTLNGGSGDDSLSGGRGDDFLVGGSGDDGMNGGTGDDVFAFDDGFGHDLILGFTIGTDTLQITSGINGSSVAAPADLISGGHVGADSFGNAVITLGSDTITLHGISVSDLTSNIDTIVQVV
ncbi:calcium-binding protein [Roseomonas stagni]|uniref:Calcium-binding protein n=1 Tax=Falsiroseomonas algicola TaxID=2716930 RepID=A0A6M1LHQ4_9PROT|nr:calcium-binding protein [Falsiroseomonas algicola]NGM19509.1 calcium-binding protein [Falsiroseomonas algicola]